MPSFRALFNCPVNAIPPTLEFLFSDRRRRWEFGILTSFVWRCLTPKILKTYKVSKVIHIHGCSRGLWYAYNRHVSLKHLA